MPDRNFKNYIIKTLVEYFLRLLCCHWLSWFAASNTDLEVYTEIQLRSIKIGWTCSIETKNAAVYLRIHICHLLTWTFFFATNKVGVLTYSLCSLYTYILCRKTNSQWRYEAFYLQNGSMKIITFQGDYFEEATYFL